MKKDIDLQDLIKIVSEIQNKDREKKVVNEQKFDLTYENIKKEFDEKPTYSEKMVFIKKIERRYIVQNFDSETRYSDLFMIEGKILEKFDNVRETYYYKRPQKLKEIIISNIFTGYNSLLLSYYDEYFAYRTQLREGHIPFYDPQYIYLYIYELFFGIGVSDEYDGFEMLFFIVTYYRDETTWINEFAFKLLLEYILEHDIIVENTKSFKKFQEFIYDFIVYNHKDLFIKNNNSKGYNISINRFVESYCYTRQKSVIDTKSLYNYLYEELPKFLNKLDEKIKQISANKTTLNDIIYTKEEKEISINPLFKHLKKDKTLNLFDNVNIKYKVSKSYYKSNIIKYQEYRITQTKERILKYICSELEYAYNEKNYLPNRTRRKLVDELDILIDNQPLSSIIDSLLDLNQAKQQQKEFNVDLTKLDNIRQISNEVSEKLITEFDLEEQKEEIIIQKEEINNLNEWETLKNQLSKEELTILEMLINNEPFDKINKFAINNNNLLEVIIENINEIANDLIGDNLIEFIDTEVYIYDEYIEEIKNIIGGKNND